MANLSFRPRLLTAALLLATLLLPAAAQANDLVLGREAPPLALTTLDGQHIDTRELKGQVVVVTFWATWCSPCLGELPLLSAYARAHAGQGLRVLALSLDDGDNLAEVRRRASGLQFPVGLLSAASLPGYGRIWRLPVSFVIDREGRLVDDGWKDEEPLWTQARLDRVVTPLLTPPERQ